MLAARVLEGKSLHVFAIPLDEAGSATSVYGEYEHRFGIEASYRMIGKAWAWAWTGSKSASLRAHLSSSPSQLSSRLLYNLWVLARIRLNEKLVEGVEGAPGRRTWRMRMFTGFIRLALELKALIKGVI